MDLAPLTTWFTQLPLALLVFTRITTLFVFGPVMGEIHTPAGVKALLGLGCTLIITPLAATASTTAIPLDGMFIILLIRELMVGLSLGFLINIYFQSIRVGGDLINRHAGYAAAENFDPDTDSVIGPIGDLFHMALIILFFAADGHHMFLAALARSYEVMPLGAWTLTPAYGQLLTTAITDMSVIALAISFPVLAAVMALTVVEGVVTRAIPQINIMHVSFALKTVLSLGVLYAGMPAAVALMGSVIQIVQQVGMTGLGLMR